MQWQSTFDWSLSETARVEARLAETFGDRVFNFAILLGLLPNGTRRISTEIASQTVQDTVAVVHASRVYGDATGAYLLLRDDVPEDLPWLLRLLPRADVYLQDEVEVALHPTLTRVWCRKGRRGQRLVEAPGNNAKEYGFGLVDWRDGWFDWWRAPKRSAPPLCAQLRRAVERSQARGRIALVLPDNLGTHTPAGSLLVRALLEELRGQLVLVYTPPMIPKPIASNGSGEHSAAPSRIRIRMTASRRC